MANVSLVIVLGHGIDPDGKLPETAKLSVDTGVEVFNKTNSSKMLMCGRWSYIYDYVPKKTEAQAMKEYAISLGLDGKNILIEDKSLDTMGNAFFAKKIVKRIAGLEKITVVTCDFHVERAKYIFERIFGDGFSIEFVGSRTAYTPEQVAKRAAFEQETLKFLKKMMEGVPSGDDSRMQEIFDNVHPLYAKSPDTVPEWVWKAFESKGKSREWLESKFFKNKEQS